jgi:predicted transposase YdaD
VTHPYQDLLEGERFHWVYLDELGEIEALPLGVALMALTTVDERDTPGVARSLLARAQQELPDASRGIIEMLTTIVVYKFTHLTRREAEAMLGINLQETRFYQEAKEEGREAGREEGGRSLAIRLLQRRVGSLTEALLTKIEGLPPEQVEELAEAIPTFATIADLESWLANLEPA